MTNSLFIFIAYVVVVSLFCVYQEFKDKNEKGEIRWIKKIEKKIDKRRRKKEEFKWDKITKKYDAEWEYTDFDASNMNLGVVGEEREWVIQELKEKGYASYSYTEPTYNTEGPTCRLVFAEIVMEIGTFKEKQDKKKSI